MPTIGSNLSSCLFSCCFEYEKSMIRGTTRIKQNDLPKVKPSKTSNNFMANSAFSPLFVAIMIGVKTMKMMYFLA